VAVVGLLGQVTNQYQANGFRTSRGILFDLDKLKLRLQKRFPDYNFDVPAPPDTKCKAPFYCSKNEIKYTDMEGNLYCGYRYKLTDEKNPFTWEWKVCHAL
jgi:hypothetical protein